MCVANLPLSKKDEKFYPHKKSVNAKVCSINLKGEITTWSFILRLALFYKYFEMACEYLNLPIFFFYLEKSANHYLNYIELHEVAQNKIDYYAADDFLKFSGKKILQDFQMWKLYRKNIKCIKLYVSWSQCCCQFIILNF